MKKEDRKDEAARPEEEAPREDALVEEEAVEPEDELTRLTRERDEYLSLAQRARADYENLRRRMASEHSVARDSARNEFALDVIGVLDDLELAIAHARDNREATGLLEGMEIVRQKFVAVLSRYGITPIEALGARFDHDYHDAMAEQPAGDVEAGTVLAEVQKGYMVGDRLLRPARVVVARALSPDGGTE